MKSIDLTSILLFAILVGGILTFLGTIIKYFNAGDILNFFDQQKHDKDKVSKLVSTDLLFIGLSVILIAIISIFINQKYYNIMMISQTVIVLFGLAITLYHQFFKSFKN
ncbi:DUF3784 domain-containing protein [Clostridium mediterraneense]|uniref:DUF3784 domain-containing protein n=1 Tax=Clostridium mediterraneense TaxID=1805472 RepID=UPI000831CB1E|nr:DUF3784 domain-containing protein [Clostridium mediterraneense]